MTTPQLIITEHVKIDDLYFIPSLNGASIKVTIDNPTSELVKRKIRLRLRELSTDKFFYEQQQASPIDLAPGKKVNSIWKSKTCVHNCGRPIFPISTYYNTVDRI